MARKINLESPRSIERFAKDALQKQQQERREFEEKIEQHHRLIRKYRVEVYNEIPNIARLFQLQRIITQFVDLLTSGKYFIGAHNTQIEGSSMSLSSFLEWKGRLSDQVISEYSSLLNSVNVRATQKAQYPKLVNGKKLSKDEADLSDYPETFEDLFYKYEDIQVSLAALREHWKETPVISETNHWQGRDGSKALLAAWIRRLEDTDKIKHIRPVGLLVSLLNSYFPNLHLGKDGRTLKDPDTNLVAEFSATILP